MSTGQDAVIATIDAKIEELQTTLDALRRTRAFFASERERQGLSITQAPVLTQGEGPTETQTLSPQGTKSIGKMILESLPENGRPMHVDTLMPRLGAKGCQASRQTVIGTLARYRKEGKVKRSGSNTYALKKLLPHEENAVPPSQKSSSVKPTEQLIHSNGINVNVDSIREV